MADKPSRALVLYGDGLARDLDSSAYTGNLHSLASFSCCGFLSLPNAPVAETEDERIVREFALLLDSCDQYTSESFPVTSLSERFMGMKTTVITSNAGLKSFCKTLGVAVFQLDELTPTELSANALTYELLKLLGFEGGQTLDSSPYDLVFVHVGAGEASKESAINMEYVNGMVYCILQAVRPGSAVGSRLHFSLLMSYGCVSDNDRAKLSIETPQNEKNPTLSAVYPCQSFMMRGEQLRKDVRLYCPMLIAQWQYAVTRKDLAKTFSFDEFKQRGGNLVIPVDRFLHEVAFKLWKAPKYGA